MIKNSSKIGYKLGQKQVRGDVIQLCGFLQKLESVLTFHFYWEYKKLQDAVFQLVKINSWVVWNEEQVFLIVVGFNQWMNFFIQDYIEILTPKLQFLLTSIFQRFLRLKAIAAFG